MRRKPQMLLKTLVRSGVLRVLSGKGGHSLQIWMDGKSGTYKAGFVVQEIAF